MAYPGLPAYAASKGGVALTKAIAGALEVELGFILENGHLTSRLGPFPML